MQALPEPLDHPVRLLIPAVIDESRPFVHVDLRRAPDEQLQLVPVEHAQQVQRQHAPEHFHERAQLLRDTPGDLVCYDEIDALLSAPNT